MIVSEDEMKNRIEKNLKTLDMYKSMWDKIIPGKIATAYHSMALESRGIAIYTLLLGNREESIEWFEQAAHNYLKCTESSMEYYHSYLESDVGVYLGALYMSIFSGNTDLMTEVANEMPKKHADIPEKFPDVAINFYYLKALESLILDKLDDVSNFTKKVAEINKTKKSDFFEGALRFIEGIQTSDANAVKEGVNKDLKVHKKRITKGLLTADELVDISGCAFLLLARDKGIEIKPSDIEEKYREYIPWNLFE
ncbi:Imm49 family immunity protein [Methanolobus psychrotolerans]|uniref:Imm49 family immunity protein n=1 Tax=Methanolobus psychrotolerans TaxID=1874706 RepID=UPI000B917C6B|nr:Imm49 family immunity protein [Methanolobus psychrotolerans]